MNPNNTHESDAEQTPKQRLSDVFNDAAPQGVAKPQAQQAGEADAGKSPQQCLAEVHDNAAA